MNRPSIGVATNFYNESKALPGFLEMASRFFDDILLMDCGPHARPSTDGSLDIIRDWGITPTQYQIDAGFGDVRTELIRRSKTDWVVIMDCDERMLVHAPVLNCEGDDRYPAVQNPNLVVTETGQVYDHRAFLINKMMEADAVGVPTVRASRRHWFTLDMRKPCENWVKIRDFQLRIWRRGPKVGYRADHKMHEKAFDWNTDADPLYVQDDLTKGPFFDHFHCWFKPMEPAQREQDIRIYQALDANQPLD